MTIKIFPAPNKTRLCRVAEYMLRVSANACKQKSGDGVPWRLAKGEIIKLTCPCCKAKGHFKYHGHYYKNNTYLENGIVKDSKIPVERLRCVSCTTTHAVISYAGVPYFSYSLRFILNLLCRWTEGTYSSIESLCDVYLVSINTFYRLKKRFFRHIYLLLGASTPVNAARAWLTCSARSTTFELERTCKEFQRAFGITPFEPRRQNASKSANAP